MQTKFVLNLAILLFLNLLVKPFWIFGIDRNIQNLAGADAYGIYFALFNFTLIFSILLDLGLTNYNTRNIAQNNHLVAKYFSKLVVLKFLLGVFYLIIIGLLFFVFNYPKKHINMFLALALSQFLLSFVLYLRSNFAGLQMFKTDSFVSIIDRLLMIIICGYWIFTDYFSGAFPIEYFAYAQAFSYFATAVIAFFILIFRTRVFKFDFSLSFFSVSLKKSFPFALLIMLMALYNRTDSIMIERLLPIDGATQSGIYAQSFRLLDALTNVAYLFSVILIPLFANMIKRNESIVKLFQLSIILIGIPSVFLFINSFFYNEALMSLLYEHHVDQSSVVIVYHMFSFVCMALSYITGSLLTAYGNMKWLNNIAIIGTLINVILNFIVIPEYKAVGASLTSAITQFAVFLLQFIFVMKFFRLKTNFLLLAKLFVLTGLIFLTIYFLHSYSSEIILNLILSAIFMVISLFLVRLVTVSELVALLKNAKR